MSKAELRRRLAAAFKPVTVRIGLVAAGLVLLFVACAARIVWLQQVEREALLERARTYQMAELAFFAKRGRVLDRNGNPLAMSVEARHLQVHTPELTEASREYVVSTVAGLLSCDLQTARRKALCGREYCYIPRAIDPKFAVALEQILSYRGDDPRMLWQQQQLAGLQVKKAAERIYPYRELAGQVLGFVRPTDEPAQFDDCRLMSLEGQSGVEAAANQMLRGRCVLHEGLKRSGKDMAFLGDEEEVLLEGNSVVLTLDVEVQKITEEELRRAVITCLGRRGIAIVMEVQSGELLAVAHFPPFNPNATGEYAKDEIWKWTDAAFKMLFEPGSTLKPATLLAGLSEGVVSLDQSFFCENGTWKVTPYDKAIEDTEPHEWLSVEECMKLSSNICLGKIGLLVGPERLDAYLRDLGLAERTGVKPPAGESAGTILSGKEPYQWGRFETANVSFGQGVSVTAVQLVTAMAALGNGGRRMRPLLIREVIDDAGNVVQEFKPEVVAEVGTPKAVQGVLRAMVSSTEEKGTGERASVYGFNVAGKTGTARQTLTVEDPYWDPAVRSAPARRSAYADRWVGAFVGLLPAESPRYAILVLVEQPYMTHYGGAVAAPAFARIAERLTAYANAPADEGRDREVTVRAGSAPGPRAAAVASGRSTSRSDTTVPAGMGPSVVPDFSGMTPARALRTAVESRLTLVAMGSGVAVSQVPAAHAVADSWGEVRVQFVPAELEPEVRE